MTPSFVITFDDFIEADIAVISSLAAKATGDVTGYADWDVYGNPT